MTYETLLARMIFFFLLWRCDPTRVMASSFLRFLDHTQRRNTFGRTPLDERSARSRDLYLTTHDTHNRQISMPPVGFEPTISAGERPAAARLLRSWVRIPPGAWIFVCCECRVLSGRGLCDELITRPEESYRLCCVVVCDLETSRIGAPYIYDISRLRVNQDILGFHPVCIYAQTDRHPILIRVYPENIVTV